MLKHFVDTADVSSHDRFQAWRTKHPEGVFLTLHTSTRANLHGSQCQHLGSGPPYFDADAGLGSLTTKRKICGPESELLGWANENAVTVQRCFHCVCDSLVPAGPSGMTSVGTSPQRNYWIIKAKPERNDFTKIPRRGESRRWYTNKLPKDWRAGDTLFLWAGSPILRVIGVARLTDPDAGYDNGADHFRVKYLTNRIEGPSISALRRDPRFRTAAFLKSGPAGTAFQLSQEQGSRLLQLLAPLLQSPSGLSGKPKLTTSGGGFGSADENEKVERAAIAAATRHYENARWTVKSIESEKRGFDLLCRKGRLLRHVEVKGVRGSGCGFIITHGEYQKAASDEKHELCLIEMALSNPTVKIFRVGEMFEAFDFVPLSYRAVPLPEQKLPRGPGRLIPNHPDRASRFVWEDGDIVIEDSESEESE
jgi:hypothetical protein